MPPSEVSEDKPEPPAMLLSRMQAALRQFQSSGKAFQLVDAGAGAAPAPRRRRCRTLIILDSSFNPPTIAHMTMATSAARDVQTQRDIARVLRGGEGSGDPAAVAAAAGEGARLGVEDGGGGGGDTRLLLLLAVNNADKAPKPASFEHRLLMMRAFATDIQRAWRRAAAAAAAAAQERGHAQQQQQQQQSGDELPVDIGLTTYPYFHDKSAAIAQAPEYEFMTTSTTSSSSSPASLPPKATTQHQQIFLAGYDTLIRIFNPKYYNPPVPGEGISPRTENKDKTPMQISLDPILARARLRVTMRTDADWGGREEQIGYVEKILHGDELEKIGGRREWAQRVEMVEAMEDKDGLVLSSTEAREAVKSKDWDKLRRLVPEGVASLIEQGEVVW